MPNYPKLQSILTPFSYLKLFYTKLSGFFEGKLGFQISLQTYLVPPLHLVVLRAASPLFLLPHLPELLNSLGWELPFSHSPHPESRGALVLVEKSVQGGHGSRQNLSQL